MNVITGLIIGVGWLVVGVVNIVHRVHWAMILLDFILGIVFLAMTVRKALRSGDGEDGENEEKK